jgi:hypothetical protein
MKNIINKIILFLTITIVVLASSYFIFNSYRAYKGYKIAQNADQYISFIKNTNKVLQKIEQECSLSALYLGHKGQMDFSQIETSRDETDIAIKNANQFILKNPKFLNNLQYVRSRVDVVSSDYKDILFTYYQDEISSALLKAITSSIQELSLGLDGLKNELYAYSDFITYKNSINREKSFIAYILSLSKKMNTQDLLLWEHILANIKLPTFSNINNQKIISDIQTTLQPQNFSQLSFKARVGIVRGVTNGNYQINIKKWFENTNIRIKRVVQSEEIIYNHLQSKLTDETSYPKVLIYNVAIALFLLIVLFILLRLQKNNTQLIRPSYTKRKQKKIQDHDMSANLPLTNLPLDDDIVFDKKIEELPAPILDDSSFNPMEEFISFTKEFIEDASEKKIELSYYIDPATPTYCVGNFIKIEQALNYLAHYIIDSSASKSVINFRIDNIAENALESAIRLSIRGHKSHFTREEKSAIHSSKYKENAKIRVGGIKANLAQVNKLISSINGGFKIEENPKKGTDFFIILNLKKQ